MLKQMRIIHLNGFSHDELYAKRSLIIQNILQSMTQLLHGMRRFGLKLSVDRQIDADTLATIVRADNAGSLVNLSGIDDELPEDIYLALKGLWSDEKVQETYKRRSEL